MADDELRKRPRPRAVRGHTMKRYDVPQPRRPKPAPGSYRDADGQRRGGPGIQTTGYRCECGGQDYGPGREEVARPKHRRHLDAVWDKLEDERIREVRRRRARER